MIAYLQGVAGVIQAVSLDQYASDLAVILAIDWLLDRCRTAVNLLGDSYGVLVVDHLVRCAALLHVA